MERDKTLYAYVYRTILNMIYNGKYIYDDYLPSLSQLCELCGVGRNTVRTALLELQENGYVSLGKGSRARVCFDINNFSTNAHFRQAMADSRQLLVDVYTTMEWIMPDIAVVCLRAASKEDIQTLLQKVDAFSTSSLTNETELTEGLIDIYLYVFTFLHNPILNDLFLALMHSIRIPLVQNQEAHKKLLRNMNSIKKTISIALSFVLKGNEFMFRKMIVAMCKSMRLMSLHYTDRITEGMTPQEEIPFSWICNRSQEYLYAKVVMDLMNDMRSGIYQNGDYLPSLAEIAKQYDVSERTSRKALKLLNEYRVVSTINGIGSKIQLDKTHIYHGDGLNQDIIQGMRHYRNSLQMMMLMANAVIPHMHKIMTKEAASELADRVEQETCFTMEAYFMVLFKNCNNCLHMIYLEIKKAMNWNLLVELIVNYHDQPLDFAQLQKEFCQNLRQRKFTKLQKVVETIMETSIRIADLAIKFSEQTV